MCFWEYPPHQTKRLLGGAGRPGDPPRPTKQTNQNTPHTCWLLLAWWVGSGRATRPAPPNKQIRTNAYIKICPASDGMQITHFFVLLWTSVRTIAFANKKLRLRKQQPNRPRIKNGKLPLLLGLYVSCSWVSMAPALWSLWLVTALGSLWLLLLGLYGSCSWVSMARYYVFLLF